MAGPSRAAAFDNNYDNPYPTPESSRSSRYSPYKSVVSHVSSEKAAFVVPTPEPAPSKPPWRRQLGQVWFGLNSQYGALLGEAVAPEEETAFSAIVERMFAGFSEKEDWVVRIDDGQEDIFSMTVDVDRDIGGSDGKSHVLYNRTEELDSTPSKPIRQKYVASIRLGYRLLRLTPPAKSAGIAANQDTSSVIARILATNSKSEPPATPSMPRKTPCQISLSPIFPHTLIQLKSVIGALH